MERELADLVRGVSRLLRRGYVERLGPLGLSPSQARALRVIADADAPLKMVQLAEELRIAPRSVTPVVDALEEAGLVRRSVDPANRRSTLLAVTASGEDVCQRAGAARHTVAQDVFAVLSTEQSEQLADLLGIVERAGAVRRGEQSTTRRSEHAG